ncbi:hypothetical protein BRD13_05640 [Halobacteriales archaeon SW_5_70_135]|nr:MAG: hypothetical protein BRD13_05640 [Halobacteriales archaeon SW_5_70_135]
MERTRRRLLAATGGGLLAALAGCGSGVDERTPSSVPDAGDGDGSDGGTPEEGGTNVGFPDRTSPPDPTPNLSFDDFRLLDRDGRLVVEVDVVNDGDEPGSATVELYVRAGDRERLRERAVSLDVGESETYAFEFEDFTREAVFADGTVRPRWKSASEGE